MPAVPSGRRFSGPENLPGSWGRQGAGTATALAAHKGGQVTEGDEFALGIDHGLHLLAHVLDDIRPRTGDPVLVMGRQAGHVIRQHRVKRAIAHRQRGDVSAEQRRVSRRPQPGACTGSCPR